MRGLLGVLTAKEFPEGFCWGILFDMDGESLALYVPNWMLLPLAGFPATGPPFGMEPFTPEALMTTDGLRLWSVAPGGAFGPLLPLTIVGVPTVGTAGGM